MVGRDSVEDEDPAVTEGDFWVGFRRWENPDGGFVTGLRCGKSGRVQEMRTESWSKVMLDALSETGPPLLD